MIEIGDNATSFERLPQELKDWSYKAHAPIANANRKQWQCLRPSERVKQQRGFVSVYITHTRVGMPIAEMLLIKLEPASIHSKRGRYFIGEYTDRDEADDKPIDYVLWVLIKR